MATKATYYGLIDQLHLGLEPFSWRFTPSLFLSPVPLYFTFIFWQMENWQITVNGRKITVNSHAINSYEKSWNYKTVPPKMHK